MFFDDFLYLFKIWVGGMFFYGGFLGVLIVLFWCVKCMNMIFFWLGDFVVLLVFIGLGVGCIGNFLNVEFWGCSIDVFWVVIFFNVGNIFCYLL